jgi:drug/metabolite transporter (DMT)-like permease
MIAVLGGFGAALAWAVSTLCSARSARVIGVPSAVAWLAIVGLVATGPIVLAEGIPARLDGAAVGWLALAGGGNVAGLFFAYRAYRIGDVSLIAPVIATEGAIAALIAIAAGERMGLATALVLVVIAAGITLAARATGSVPTAAAAADDHLGEPAPRAAAGEARVVILAALAAACFGASLYATGHVSSRLPLAWVVLPARLLATGLVAVPLVLARRLRLTRATAPLVLASGLAEVLGFASFTLGARHDIAVAAVLSCQFAAISAVAAYFLFRERLARPQLAGVLLLLGGVSVLSGLRA